MKGPNRVIPVKRSVIAGKLLDALTHTESVAILLSKQDCDDMHAALCGYALGEREGDTLKWQAWIDRCKNLAEGIDQLRREAFGGDKSKDSK